VRGTDIFRDEIDRRRYLQILGTVSREQRWNCLLFCLMTNHLHLLIETPEANLGRGMSKLHGTYAPVFNRRHGVTGHLFERRYGDVPIKDDAHLITIVRYLDDNPVKGGIVTAPEEWPWCSSAALRGAARPTWLRIDRLFELIPEERIELANY
jgi:REP element-mobilizing transposase RayT